MPVGGASVQRWVFTDPSGATPATYTLPFNPDAGGLPHFQKNIQYQNTCAPGGGVIIFEGPDQVLQTQVSGTILTEDHYYQFTQWFQKRHQYYITDDNLNQWTVYMTDLQFTRVRSATFPWKMTWTMTLLILAVTYGGVV